MANMTGDNFRDRHLDKAKTFIADQMRHLIPAGVTLATSNTVLAMPKTQQRHLLPQCGGVVISGARYTANSSNADIRLDYTVYGEGATLTISTDASADTQADSAATLNVADNVTLADQNVVDSGNQDYYLAGNGAVKTPTRRYYADASLKVVS